MEYLLAILFSFSSIFDGGTSVTYEGYLDYKSFEQHQILEYQKPITVNLTGDILLGASLSSFIEKNGVDYPFEKVKHILEDADITFGNLETSVSTRGTPMPNKQFTFRSKPETLQGLVNAGYDGVSLANNHTLDYGEIALFDTIDNLKEYNIGYAGAGKNNDESFAPYTKIVNGKKVSIVAVSRVLPEASWFSGENKPGIASAYSNEPMLSYIEKSVNDSDYTIVFIHWNKELKDYPEDYARTLAKKFIDLGVDAVIGGHSHTLMGIEFYKNKPIYYSIGNFVFTTLRDQRCKETMIVNLTFENDKVSTKFIPAEIINGQPNLKDEDYNKKIYSKISKISYNAYVNDKGEVVEK